MNLTDKQQAFLMLLVFVLPPVVVWLSQGMPTDRTAIGLLLSSVLSGFLAALKEALGWKES